MPGSISIDTLDTYARSLKPRSRTSTQSVDSWTIVNAAAATAATRLSRTSEADPASQAPAQLRSHLPDTSADLTRNWLTSTAPPPFSRKGVVDVVMPVKAARSLNDPGQKERTQTTSRALQEEGGRRGYTRHHHTGSQLQPHGSLRLQRSEEGEWESEARLTEERTLGWVTLSRAMSTGSSRRRPGLRERKNHRETHEDHDGRGTGTRDEEAGLGIAGEGDCVEGRKLRRKWPWDTFLKKADKRLGKKDTL